MSTSKLDLFRNFFQSEKTGGFLLIACTVISLIIANSFLSDDYRHFWHYNANLSFWKVELNYSIEHWVNDGLMTIFFLLVGLEIERELYVGELSTFKNAVLPVIAAVGGMLFPALIHYIFNQGSPTQPGFGIPMATDIAFALAILSLAGKKVPVALKVFLTALAIIDDLGAIIIIALFYTKGFSAYYFFAALAVFLILFIAGKRKVSNLAFYLVGGMIMWYCMLKSGVHPTIAGVLLAFAIPFNNNDQKNLSYEVQQYLHYPVAFFILPVFAFANTAIMVPVDLLSSLKTNNSIGIILGLLLGKFIGIFIVSWLAVRFRIASLSSDLSWRHIAGVAILGGIGFTMSIFITNLAFDEAQTITSSKMSILFASMSAAVIGLFVLRQGRKRKKVISKK